MVTSGKRCACASCQRLGAKDLLNVRLGAGAEHLVHVENVLLHRTQILETSLSQRYAANCFDYCKKCNHAFDSDSGLEEVKAASSMSLGQKQMSHSNNKQ